MSKLEDSSILITGGTGSFGKAFIAHALEHLGPRRLAILSRDELKQSEMRSYLTDSRLRFFIGDVRDQGPAHARLPGRRLVIHAAALKQVPRRRVQPVRGRQDERPRRPERHRRRHRHGRQAGGRALDRQGRRTRSTSTAPRSCAPTSSSSRATPTRPGQRHGASACVRYGNVVGSRGSVVPFFQSCIERGSALPITDARMTRFWITLPQAVDFVVDALDTMHGGEIFVPQDPAHAHHRPGRGDGARLPDHDRRHPPRREAARGDDHRRRERAHDRAGGPLRGEAAR